MTQFEESVRRVIASLKRGEVATYGEVAEEAGYPGAARAVGGVLARSEGLPWWRVVTSTGRLVPGHEHEQSNRLHAEGVQVIARRAAGGGRKGRSRWATQLESSGPAPAGSPPSVWGPRRTPG